MEDLYVDTPIGRVFGKRAGSPAASLVLGIHGWSQRNGWHTWEPLMAPLAQAGFQVVCVDMPGWGNSTSVAGSPLRTSDAVRTIVALIAELQAKPATDLQPVTLLGKSWGGGLALQVALDYPPLVSHLILTAPAFRAFERLPEITQPVLLAWAEDDPVIPHSYAARFVSALPNVELISYPAGGHSAAPKNVTDFAPRAIRFLQAADN